MLLVVVHTDLSSFWLLSSLTSFCKVSFIFPEVSKSADGEGKEKKKGEYLEGEK